MKREIKFRGISIDTEKWVIGYGIILADDMAQIIHKQGNNMTQYTNVDLETVGQFVGLNSKTDKPLCEGDICTKMISPDEINLAPKELYRGVIEYHVGSFCLKVGEYYYPMSRTHGVIDIIGNIHQNPDSYDLLTPPNHPMDDKPLRKPPQ